MNIRFCFSFLLCLGIVSLKAEEITFAKDIEPFLSEYCLDCHDDIEQEGDVALHDLKTITPENAGMWKRVWEVTALKKMPPVNKRKQPSIMDRHKVSQWITGGLEKGMKAHGGFKKHRHPKKGNHIDHDLLFNAPLDKLDLEPASSPARIWRIHPMEHMVRLNDFMSRTPFDPERPFARTRGDWITSNEWGEVKVYFGFDRYLGHVGGEVAKQSSAKGFAALLNMEQSHGLRNHAHMYSVNGAEAIQISAAAEDILKYMAYGMETYIPESQFFNSVKEIPSKQIDMNLRGTTRGIFFEKDDERPKTPIYYLMQPGPLSQEHLEASIRYLYEGLTLRSIDAETMRKYKMIVTDAAAEMGKERGVFMGLSSIFMDTNALFRSELAEYGSPDEAGRVMLQGEELLLALNGAFAYIQPDATLRQAYESGRLKTRADVKREVERMLSDPSFRKPRILQFFREYFDYDLAPVICKDEKILAKSVPSKNPAKHLRMAANRMVNDTDFLVEMIVGRDRDVLKELLTTKEFVYGGESFYSVPFFIHEDEVQEVGWAGRPGKKAKKKKKGAEQTSSKNTKPEPDFKKIIYGNAPNIRNLTVLGSVAERHQKMGILADIEYLSKLISDESYEVDVRRPRYEKEPSLKRKLTRFETDQRMGILTHPAWLISHSDAMDNHAIHRGIWIRERLLGGSIPDVPITVDAMLPDERTPLRHRMRVTREKECWTCHQAVDPLGLAFEMYNHVGMTRTKEFGKPVDASGEIIRSGDPALDGPVSNAIEMIEKLANSERVEQVFIRHLFRFWMGRNETLNDAPILREAHSVYKASGGSLKQTLVSLLTSDAFLYRKVDSEKLSGDLTLLK